MGKSIVKNTAFMTAASIGQKIVSFVYFTLIARNIGAEGTGKYFFALSFTTIFVIFVDLGLTNVLVREAAKVKEKIQAYFSTILSVKIVLGVLVYIVAIVTINLLQYPVETKHLVYLSAVTMFFDSIHLTIYGTLRAIGDLKYEAASIVGSQLMTLVLGSIFLYAGLPLIFLILAFTIPSFLNLLYVGYVARHVYSIRFIPTFDKKIFLFLGRIAIPFALAAIFARLYSYADSILLSKMAGDVAVGWYSIAYKITYAFQFIPLALIAALYPRFSEYFVHSKDRLAYVFERAVVYLLLIVLPIAVGIGILARDIVITVFTVDYINAIVPLQILLAGLVFSFISFPVGAFLNACNRQVTQTVITAGVLVVNVTLNLVLIPRMGVSGAAVAALVGNMLLTVFGYMIVPKITHISHLFLFKKTIQLLVSVIVMGFSVWFINTLSHFTVAILVGAVVYPVMLFVTRALTRGQLREAAMLVKR
jgi:O-antigen/teichoic acid export membrane protein